MIQLRRIATRCGIILLVVLAAALVGCASGEQVPQADTAGAIEDQQTQSSEPRGDHGPPALKLGLLLDFSGSLAEFGIDMRRGFELAIEHINEAGGVFGRPVEFVISDSALDPTFAVEEARRLIEVERAHAIVGALSSAVTLPLAESIAGPLRTPVISPSAQSRQITIANDDDFLFRMSPPSGPEADVLIQLLQALGYDSVGLMARNDAWGQSFADAFLENWTGEAVRVDFDALQGSYLAEVQHAARGEPDALVLLAFPTDAEVMIRESIEWGVFEQFVFTAGGESRDLAEAIGPWIAGMYGTAPAADPSLAHAADWLREFESHFGEAPLMPYVRETYDATIALAVAAQRAGSVNGRVDGEAIRDQLRPISEAPGEQVPLTAQGVARALELAAAGADIDLEGASSSMAWDEHGDPRRAYIKIWQFTEDDDIRDIGSVLWENGEIGDISGLVQP